MPKFRKTALIEASQWRQLGDHPAVTELPEQYRHSQAVIDGRGWIETLEGGHVVTPGDWIAGPGAAGEFWPIKPDVFAATYEPAE